MTVKELRKALAGLKPDLPVCLKTDGGTQPIERAQVGTVWDANHGNMEALVLLVP